MTRRKRRVFTPEFKAEAVGLVLDRGQTVAAVAKDLDILHTSLSSWVKQARVDRGLGKQGELTSSEIEELRALRKEVRVLREEREILKKATAFFASQKR